MADLEMLEFSDFLVERVRPRHGTSLSLPGRANADVGISTGDIVIAGGCCCCCCCCNCNSGGSGPVQQRQIAGDDFGISSSAIAVQPGPEERRSHLDAARFTIASSEKLTSFSSENPRGGNPSVKYSVTVAGVGKGESTKDFVTHTWYGPERTIRFGGVIDKRDPESVSEVELDGLTDGLWKVIARDISGAIISFAVVELTGDNLKVIDVEFSPVAAVRADVQSSPTDADDNKTFSPRLGRLFFVTEFDTELDIGQIQHAWFKGSELVQVVNPGKQEKSFVSKLDLPSDSLGGWYVVATDESGRHITSAPFSVRP